MTTPVLGIDISKDSFDVALLRDDAYQIAAFDNNKAGWRKLYRWLKKQKAQRAHVCLEATGRYGDGVAAFLYERHCVVSVVNPSRIKAYAASQLKRNKTDREDAKVIAHFCATQQPDLWSPPTPDQQELQALVRHRAALKESLKQEKNRRQSGVPSKAVLKAIDKHIIFLCKQIDQIEADIDDLIDQDDGLRQQRELLTSITGIGDTTAAHFMAEVPDISRFNSAAQLAAYAGLTPARRQSSLNRRGHLSKMGNVRLRSALFVPAMVAIQHNKLLLPFVQRLQERGKPKMVILAAVMRKLLHIMYGVLKHQQPFDPNYLINLQISS